MRRSTKLPALVNDSLLLWRKVEESVPAFGVEANC